jgi:hypothetical protein
VKCQFPCPHLSLSPEEISQARQFVEADIAATNAQRILQAKEERFKIDEARKNEAKSRFQQEMADHQRARSAYERLLSVDDDIQGIAMHSTRSFIAGGFSPSLSQFSAISSALAITTSLEILDLSGACLLDAYEQFFDGLLANRSLTSLHLQGCQLSTFSDAPVRVGQLIRRHPCLTSLDISSNDFWDDSGIIEQVESALRGNGSLIVLNLVNNNVPYPLPAIDKLLQRNAHLVSQKNVTLFGLLLAQTTSFLTPEHAAD